MATIKSELDYIQEARSQLAEALITKFGVRRYDNAKDNPTLKGLWTVKADGSADKLKRLHDWALLVTGTNVHTDASLTFKNDGKGDAAGTTFNGSVARSISYNSIGAAASNHVHKNLIIKWGAGDTEGTNLFTYNGSTAKTINLSAPFSQLFTSFGNVDTGFKATNITATVSGVTKSFAVNWAIYAGRSQTADKWTTARTLTIGNTRKSVDGSANVSWSLAEIGVSAAAHTHSVKINGATKTIAASNGAAVDLGNYLPLSGGTMSGSIILKGSTSPDMTYASNVHPYIRFDNSDSSQNVSLIFTDHDTYRSPAGIKLIGNQGGEWFEAPNIYAINFYGTLSGNASSATKLTSSAGSTSLPIYFSDGKPVACTASSLFSNLSNSGNNLSITVAGQNRTLTINYANKADSAIYLPITSGITTETSITESGLRVYAGSGSRWTGSVTSMAYAGIITLGTPSRGFQIWARRGTGNNGSLHFRVGNNDANAWESERIVLDNVNWTSYINIPIVTNYYWANIKVSTSSSTSTSPTFGTFYGKLTAKDNTAANALLHSGAGRPDSSTGDTWIFADDLDLGNWGIKHDQPGNNIDFYGQGKIKFHIPLYNEDAYSTNTFKAPQFIITNSGTCNNLIKTTNSNYSDMLGINDTAGTGGVYIGQNKYWIRTGNASEHPKVLRNGIAYTLWHAGNDGSGSGLDADLLDGKHASDFAINNHNHINYLSANGNISGNIDNIWTHGTYGFRNRSNYTGTLPGNSSYGGFLVLNPYATTKSYYTTQIALLPSYFGYRIYDDGKWYDWKEVSMVGHNHDGKYLRYEGWWNSGSGQNVNDSLGMTFTYTNHGAPHHWGTTVTFEGSRNSSYRLQLHGTGDNYLFFRNRSSDYGGWHSSGWKQILTNQDTYVSGNKGYINGTEITYVNNADKLDGCHATMGSSKPWGTIPAIGSDGVIDLGRYIDWHYDNTTGSDYSTRLQASGNHSNVVNLPSASGTLALTSQLPTKASWNYDDRYLKLSGGTLTGQVSIYKTVSGNAWDTQHSLQLVIGCNESYSCGYPSIGIGMIKYNNTYYGIIQGKHCGVGYYHLALNPIGGVNVAIGKTHPSYKLDVYGDCGATNFYSTSDIRYKKIINNIKIDVITLSKIPLFNFKWIDTQDELIHSGTSAQAVKLILPNVVSTKNPNKWHLDYAVLGTIAGITACKELVAQKSEIDLLKERIEQLEQQLKMINDYGRC